MPSRGWLNNKLWNKLSTIWPQNKIILTNKRIDHCIIREELQRHLYIGFGKNDQWCRLWTWSRWLRNIWKKSKKSLLTTAVRDGSQNESLKKKLAYNLLEKNMDLIYCSEAIWMLISGEKKTKQFLLYHLAQPMFFS